MMPANFSASFTALSAPPSMNLLSFSLFFLGLIAISLGQDCLVDPSDPACRSFTYPDVNSTADLVELCMVLSSMPGCTISSICATAHQGDPYCLSFSLLGDVCATDMPEMNGCNNYTALCAPSNSVVQQCDSEPPIPGLPTTAQANNAIKSVCGQHYISGCEKCVDNGGVMSCDLLRVYSEICLAMPDMPDCTQWKQMCESIPDWSELCPSSDVGQPPSMKMYFHTGITDYILFETWVPRTNGAYAGAIFGVIMLAFAFEGLQTFRAYMEFLWRPEGSGTSKVEIEQPLNSSTNPQLAWGQTPFRPWVDFQRSILHVLEIFVGNCAMLIVMTFNVGLILGLLAGYFLGKLTFGRYGAYVPKSCCD